MAGAVHHAHILPALAVLTQRGHIYEPDKAGYLAMQRAGPTLRSILKQRRLSTREVVVWGQQVASAVSWMHAKQLVHQDLQTNNILQSLHGPDLLVADFDNADWVYKPGTTDRTRLRRYKCGVGIEAPEMAQQLHREQLYNPDDPQDVYALGLLLLEMAGGRKPAGHEEALLQALEAGPLQGSAFTQEYARNLCVRAPHQPAYRDMVFVPAKHASATIDDVSIASIIKGCLETDPALCSSSWLVNEQLSLLNNWW